MTENVAVRILLVEDDRRMRALLKRGLSEHGHLVDEASSGPAGLLAARASHFDALVVDVMLPGLSGVELVRQLRAGGRLTPALMLTARGADADVVAGLDAGADDYLVKPFAFDVLLARLRALGRRSRLEPSGPLRVADLVLDDGRHVVTRGATVVPLTVTEYRLLECLMRRAGRVVTRTALYDSLWGDGRQVESNTLDAFIKSLRQKIDAGDRPRLIQTVRGVGYSVREAPDA